MLMTNTSAPSLNKNRRAPELKTYKIKVMSKVKYSYVTYRYDGEVYENEKYPGEGETLVKANITISKDFVENEDEIEILDIDSKYVEPQLDQK